MALFDEDLKNLINASSKIFPISQIDIDTNNNPNNYEYAKVDRSIYIWQIDKWEYVIADDNNIEWVEIKNKPTSYPPNEHTHLDLHNHLNKSTLDNITQLLIDGWNSAVTHITDNIKHITSGERTLWNTVSDKASTGHVHTEADINNLDKYTKLEVDNKVGTKANTVHEHDAMYFTETEINALLLNKSNTTHDHDGRYFTESEVSSLLSGKSATTHSHTDLHAHLNKSILDKIIESESQTDYDLSQLQYIEDIRSGYTEGHMHTNLTVLESITQLLIDGWNSAVTHISDLVKHITSDERTLWDTVSTKPDAKIATDTTVGTLKFNGSTKLAGSSYGSTTAPSSTTRLNYDGYLYATRLYSSAIQVATLTGAETLTGKTLTAPKLATNGYIADAGGNEIIKTIPYVAGAVNEICVGNALTGQAPHVMATGGDVNIDLHLEAKGTGKVYANSVEISLLGHSHNDTYFTEAEVTALLVGKAEASTLSGHTGSTTIHVTQTDKDNWNNKSGIAIGTVKPTDGSMWYEEIS